MKEVKSFEEWLKDNDISTTSSIEITPVKVTPIARRKVKEKKNEVTCS